MGPPSVWTGIASPSRVIIVHRHQQLIITITRADFSFRTANVPCSRKGDARLQHKMAFYHTSIVAASRT